MLREGIELGEALDKPREACGVVGYFTPDASMPVGEILYQAAYALQHRGEEGGGVVVYAYGGERRGVKDTGLLEKVMPYQGQEVDWLCADSRMGIAHTRYGTSGGADSQPFWGENETLAHNGNIPNAEEVALEIGVSQVTDRTVTDSEWVTKSIDHLRQIGMDLHEALDRVLPKLKGAYCFVITDGTQLVAVRDPNGLRPLSLGYRLEDGGYVVASETPALQAADATFMRDIQPGEILTINDAGLSSRLIDAPIEERICAFEYTYTARADSVIRGRSVRQAREAMGATLAAEIEMPPADIVIGMPATAIVAATAFAKASGIPLETGAVTLDRYKLKRSFQMPTQEQREQMVDTKFHLDELLIRGNRILVVDDSIVRGTTMRRFVDRLRQAGATGVDLAITSPPIKWPCFHGVNTGDPNELIANKMVLSEMAEYFGADSVQYLSLEGWKRSIFPWLGGASLGRLNLRSELERAAPDIGNIGLCTACIDGDYVVDVPEHLLAAVPVSLR